jgi:hypothetical protein
VSGRHSTRLLAPPSRHPAVGQAEPTPATARRRGGLGRDSAAETYPLRAVGACRRGSKSVSYGKPRDGARPITSAHADMPLDARSFVREGPRATALTRSHTTPSTSATARARGGRVPPTHAAGAPCSPPGCDRATTLPFTTGGVWHVVGRDEAALRTDPRAVYYSIALHGIFACQLVGTATRVSIHDDAHVKVEDEAPVHGLAVGEGVDPVATVKAPTVIQITYMSPLAEKVLTVVLTGPSLRAATLRGENA